MMAMLIFECVCGNAWSNNYGMCYQTCTKCGRAVRGESDEPEGDWEGPEPEEEENDTD